VAILFAKTRLVEWFDGKDTGICLFEYVKAFFPDLKDGFELWLMPPGYIPGQPVADHKRINKVDMLRVQLVFGRSEPLLRTLLLVIPVKGRKQNE
jgi:hypothetical protein